MDGKQLEHVSKSRYLGFGFNKRGTNGTECHNDVMSAREAEGTFKPFENARGL